MTDDIVPLEPDSALAAPIATLPEKWRDRGNRFIALYASDPEVTMEQAAAQIGMSYSGVYAWTQADADFDERLSEISRIHSLQIIQRVVKSIVDAATKPQKSKWVETIVTDANGDQSRIREKTDVPNLRAAMFLIERHEQRYGESNEITAFAFAVGIERDGPKGRPEIEADPEDITEDDE